MASNTTNSPPPYTRRSAPVFRDAPAASPPLQPRSDDYYAPPSEPFNHNQNMPSEDNASDVLPPSYAPPRYGPHNPVYSSEEQYLNALRAWADSKKYARPGGVQTLLGFYGDERMEDYIARVPPPSFGGRRSRRQSRRESQAQAVDETSRRRQQGEGAESDGHDENPAERRTTVAGPLATVPERETTDDERAGRGRHHRRATEANMDFSARRGTGRASVSSSKERKRERRASKVLNPVGWLRERRASKY